MTTGCDVVTIGAGAAGLTAAALLALEGQRVTVLEQSPHLGGRAMAVVDEGFNLLEDPGSGITKIFDIVGKELIHGQVSRQMPVWDHEKETWGSVKDRYAGKKGQLKKVIDALLKTPFEELDRWDDRCLREWLAQHTDDAGVIDLFEFLAVLEGLTTEWWDHSASDNLYARKMHYSERNMAGYSFWPGQGWDGMFRDLADAAAQRGASVRLGTPVERVVIEDGAVRGVMVARQPRMVPNEIFEEELVEADCVICTLPVWSVLRVVSEEALPDWYAGQIRHLAQDQFRAAWLGLYLATEDPIAIIDRKELCTWLHSPELGSSGFLFEMTAMDPATAPPGVHLYVMGGCFNGRHGRDRTWLLDGFERFERDMVAMFPGFADAVWRRRHLVFDPGFGIAHKPGLVGTFRPHWRAPNIEGLYFASETFRSRGIGVDRAARAGLTVVEEHLGRRITGLDDSWRY